MISWNVTDFVLLLKKGFNDFVQDEDPDILCIQEIKLQAGQVELKFSPNTMIIGIMRRKRAMPALRSSPKKNQSMLLMIWG